MALNAANQLKNESAGCRFPIKASPNKKIPCKLASPIQIQEYVRASNL
jgi:hypothetical protein